jgi:hypothetical protein
MLERLPDLTIAGETHWITFPFKERRGLTPDGCLTQDLVRRIRNHPRFSRLGLSVKEVDAAVTPLYSEFVTALFDLYARNHNKPLAGDKTPSYARFITELHHYWPKARFIHLIRDGRDVCLSLLNWSKAEHAAGRFATWEVDRLVTSALRWDWNVRLAREAASRLPKGLYREIRYEAIVSDPRAAARELCTFLDQEFDSAMLRFHETKTRSEPGLDAKHAWLPITPGLRDWRTQMDPEDVLRFEAAAGALLEELGFERGHSRIPAATVQHVAEIKRDFADDAAARGRAVPLAWGT